MPENADYEFFGHSVLEAEMQYNIAICNLFLGNKKEALTTFKLMMIDQEILSQEARKMVQILKTGPINAEEGEKSYSIFPFDNRFSGIFEPLEYTFVPDIENYTEEVTVKLRLSFCVPVAKPPHLSFNLGLGYLEDLNLQVLDYRPEAPWIKRGTEGIMYTREIVDQDVVEVKNESDLVDNLMKNNKLNFNSKVKFEALKHYGNSASLLEIMRKSF